MTDIVAPDLRVLFVAINPPPAAAESGEPFATPSNAFWRLLHESKLTRRRYLPTQARRLLDDGIGLVSLVDRPTAQASELHTSELREGAVLLTKKVARWRPRVVALLGVTLLPFVLPDEKGSGPGPKKGTVAGVRVFVVPNPSGRNLSFPGLGGKLPWYEQLALIAD